MEYHFRKEFNGYFPEDDLDKQHFFLGLFLAYKEKERKKAIQDNLRNIAKKGGN
jgi:hypothetical protein